MGRRRPGDDVGHALAADGPRERLGAAAVEEDELEAAALLRRVAAQEHGEVLGPRGRERAVVEHEPQRPRRVLAPARGRVRVADEEEAARIRVPQRGPEHVGRDVAARVDGRVAGLGHLRGLEERVRQRRDARRAREDEELAHAAAPAAEARRPAQELLRGERDDEELHEEGQGA